MKRKSAISAIFMGIMFMVMFFLSCNKVNAEFYDASANYVVEDSISVNKNANTIKFTMRYQNGVKDVLLLICETYDSNFCRTDSALL